jgi:hypothetical protein
MKSILVILVVYVACCKAQTHEDLVKTVTDSVNANEHKFYKLTEPGDIRLVLKTLEGDADLYASEDGYNEADFQMQSITYGDDEIFIAKSMQRPITIAVYAHPYYPHSSYVLKFFNVHLEDERVETTFEKIDENYKRTHSSQSYEASRQEQHQTSKKQEKRNIEIPTNESDSDDEESLLWKVFMLLLNVIAEVIL